MTLGEWPHPGMTEEESIQYDIDEIEMKREMSHSHDNYCKTPGMCPLADDDDAALFNGFHSPEHQAKINAHMVHCWPEIPPHTEAEHMSFIEHFAEAEKPYS